MQMHHVEEFFLYKFYSPVNEHKVLPGQLNVPQQQVCTKKPFGRYVRLLKMRNNCGQGEIEKRSQKKIRGHLQI